MDLGEGRRCCLGHMCYALKDKLKLTRNKVNSELDIRWTYNNEVNYPPETVTKALGLFLYDGSSVSKQHIEIGGYKGRSLSELNDISDVTPQQIGQYLKQNIEGGNHTPWESRNFYSNF